MPYEKGGRADKKGNKYEINCIVYELLKVLDGSNYSVVIEALGEDEKGTDILVTNHEGKKEHQQCKARNGSSDNWTISDLKARKIFNASVFRNLPARNITVHTIQKSCIGSHFRWEWIKQAGCLQKRIHTLVNISYEYHGSLCLNLCLSTGKCPGSHISFHDLDAIFIFEFDTGNLIKCHTIPHPRL